MVSHQPIAKILNPRDALWIVLSVISGAHKYIDLGCLRSIPILGTHGHAIPELGTAAIPIPESDVSDSGRNSLYNTGLT